MLTATTQACGAGLPSGVSPGEIREGMAGEAGAVGRITSLLYHPFLPSPRGTCYSSCMHSTLRRATFLALGTASISGTANFVNKFAVSAMKDPVAFTTLKNGLVALLLIGVIALFG